MTTNCKNCGAPFGRDRRECEYCQTYAGPEECGAPIIVQHYSVQNSRTGELGTRYLLNDGNSFDVFLERERS